MREASICSAGDSVNEMLVLVLTLHINADVYEDDSNISVSATPYLNLAEAQPSTSCSCSLSHQPKSSAHNGNRRGRHHTICDTYSRTAITASLIYHVRDLANYQLIMFQNPQLESKHPHFDSTSPPASPEPGRTAASRKSKQQHHPP